MTRIAVGTIVTVPNPDAPTRRIEGRVVDYGSAGYIVNVAPVEKQPCEVAYRRGLRTIWCVDCGEPATGWHDDCDPTCQPCADKREEWLAEAWLAEGD